MLGGFRCRLKIWAEAPDFNPWGFALKTPFFRRQGGWKPPRPVHNAFRWLLPGGTRTRPSIGSQTSSIIQKRTCCALHDSLLSFGQPSRSSAFWRMLQWRPELSWYVRGSSERLDTGWDVVTCNQGCRSVGADVTIAEVPLDLTNYLAALASLERGGVCRRRSLQ